jgi:hypothetical protein
LTNLSNTQLNKMIKNIEDTYSFLLSTGVDIDDMDYILNETNFYARNIKWVWFNDPVKMWETRYPFIT